MITKLNLSSKPFRNRKLPWILSALMIGLSAIGIIWALAQRQSSLREAELVKTNIQEMTTQIDGLKSQGEQVKQSLTPDQQSLLTASHKLVAEKQFSWSRLFADLESVLPGGVSVSQIKVVDISQKDGKPIADLDFAVLSRNYESVVNMVSTMNDSGLFQAELRGQDLQVNERGSFTEYNLRLRYAPRASVPTGENTETTIAAVTEQK